MFLALCSAALFRHSKYLMFPSFQKFLVYNRSYPIQHSRNYAERWIIDGGIKIVLRILKLYVNDSIANLVLRWFFSETEMHPLDLNFNFGSVAVLNPAGSRLHRDGVDILPKFHPPPPKPRSVPAYLNHDIILSALLVSASLTRRPGARHALSLWRYSCGTSYHGTAWPLWTRTNKIAPLLQPRSSTLKVAEVIPYRRRIPSWHLQKLTHASDIISTNIRTTALGGNSYKWIIHWSRMPVGSRCWGSMQQPGPPIGNMQPFIPDLSPYKNALTGFLAWEPLAILFLWPMFSPLAALAILGSVSAYSHSSLHPRFLQEAHTLSARGTFENGVLTLPLKARSNINSAPGSVERRMGTTQLAIGDYMDEAYVSVWLNQI